MRINRKPGSTGNSHGMSRTKASNTPSSNAVAPTPASDVVLVSSAARLVAVAQETLAVVPDIRMEKVKAIKNQLDADEYNPDGGAVAEGLIKDNMAKGRRH